MKQNKKLLLFVVLLIAVAATITRKVSDFPNVASPSSGDLFLIESGSTNKNIRFDQLKDAVNTGVSNTTVTNFTAITNNSTVINSTTINSTTINANVAKGGHLTITNEVWFPYVTLTLTGTNVSTISLTNSSAFKLTLTGDAFVDAATDLPGTNYLGSYQLFIAQDGTGARAIWFTNSYWVIAGSGTSTNAQPAITTNANAVSILTFSTSPFANKAYGVITATGP